MCYPFDICYFVSFFFFLLQNVSVLVSIRFVGECWGVFINISVYLLENVAPCVGEQENLLQMYS